MAGLLPKILDTNDDPTPPIYRNEPLKQRDESSSKLSASEVDDQESEKEES